MNKKGILGSGLATLLAILIVGILIGFFFLASTIFVINSEERILDERGLLLDDSSDVIALLKTESIIGLFGGQETFNINDYLMLYSMGEIGEDLVKAKIKDAFKKSYGECYAFRYESDAGVLQQRWVPSEESITTMSLPTGKFSLRNLYAYCLQKDTLANCDIFCRVDRQ